MGGPALRIGSVRGIDIRIHRSWIIIALLIAWSFYQAYASGERGVVAAGVMAITAALLFFASILVHELAHSLEARQRGVEVGGITLFLFGGVTETRFDVERPRDEFILTAAGPFASFVLAGAFGLVAFYSGRAGIGPIATITGSLAWLNAGVGAFNLLPGAPLDGGRILRSLVWAVTGDRSKAVRVASRSGQVLGLLIGAAGVWQLLASPAGFVGGIWLAFIGWFLFSAARSELVQQELRVKLAGRTVGDLVDSETLPTVPGDTDLATVAAELMRRPQETLAVVDEQGRTIGLLCLDHVAAVPPARRPDRRASDVATPMQGLPTIPAGTGFLDALRTVRGDQPAAVLRNDEILGLISEDQIRRVVTRALRLDGVTAGARLRPEQHIPHRASSGSRARAGRGRT